MPKLTSPKLQGLLLIFVGIALISSFIFWKSFQAYQKTVLSFAKEPAQETQVYGVKPSRILITDAKIDLSIEETQIVEGIWQIPEKNTGHLSTSATPGSGGNIVIYGHNKGSIFGNLKAVKNGQIIEVFNEVGERYRYEVTEIKTVDPKDISVVEPTDFEVLTVYTCTGFLDSRRLVVKAKPLI